MVNKCFPVLKVVFRRGRVKKQYVLVTKSY